MAYNYGTNDPAYYVQQFKQNYLDMYKDKQLSELKQLFSIINPDSAGNDIVKKATLVGEQSAVVELMLKLQDTNRKIFDAEMDSYHKAIAKRIEENAINMKYASSPNGQLVASILEEGEDLTAEEIGSWCDEMRTIPPKQLTELLNGLKKEGIVSEKNGKYHLSFVYTGKEETDILYQNALIKVHERFDDSPGYSYELNETKDSQFYDKILTCFYVAKWCLHVNTVADMRHASSREEYMEIMSRGATRDKDPNTDEIYRILKNDLKGILSSYQVNGLELFYFTLPGDKEA